MATLAVALALAACGSSSNSADGGPTADGGVGGDAGDLTLGTLTDRFAGAMCHQYFTCCSAPELADIFGSPVTDAECRAMFASLYALSDLSPDVAAGHTIFNLDAATACIATLSSDTCPEFTHVLPSACNATTIFTGTIALTAACLRDTECVPGSYCHNDVCTATAGQGESCAAVRCSDGLYCDTTCQAPKANGATCASILGECQSGFCETPANTCAVAPPECTGN